MFFDKVLKDIKEKRFNKQNGLYNGVPFTFPKWRDYIDSIDRGMYYGLLGGTGTGKSRLMRNMFVYDVVRFSMERNYPVRILYFALEDGKLLTYKKIISHYLWERQSVILPAKYLDSKEEPLSKKYLDMIEGDRAFYVEFEDRVEIINDCTSPREICTRCYEEQQKYPDRHIIVLIDNYSNVTRDEGHDSEWAAIKQLSREFIRLYLCKKLQMTVVGILQLDMESEKFTFRNSKVSISQIEPNLGSIGDAKVIARDMFNIFALFNPWRYEIPAYPYSDGWKTEILRNRFRSLIHLKNNEGEIAPRLGLLFNGAIETFSEMPSPKETEALERIYKAVLDEEQRRIDAKSRLF
jgi:hypothetical protein